MASSVNGCGEKMVQTTRLNVHSDARDETSAVVRLFWCIYEAIIYYSSDIVAQRLYSRG